ncbi:DUF115 domain-containing protein [bacterium D16-51]|nr:DUF115 domain-containing protein [bacterium D16-59]RKI62777.1 DUF115 domain-containing protein [bacterium D16-51]
MLFQSMKSLIHLVTDAIQYFRVQNFQMAYDYTKQVINLMQQCLLLLEPETAASLLPVLEMVLGEMEEQDGIRLADVLEEGLLPELYQIQAEVFESSEGVLEDYWGKSRLVLKKRYPDLYRKILEYRDKIPDNYQLSWAKTGDLALDVATDSGVTRLNSMYNPWNEAVLFVQNLVGNKQDKEYIILGFGMGYHLEVMLKECPYEKIIVLENDLNQLAVALSYRDLSWVLEKEQVELVYCRKAEDYFRYLSEIKSGTKVGIWYPSVKTVLDSDLREALENYKLELSSVENIGSELEGNFLENIKREDTEVSVLRQEFYGKKVILAAGGPSLDEGIELLRNRNEDVRLICVGKVARKLLAAGIQPNYIVMTDGMAKTRWQISGIEECGIPLIYLSTAACGVVGAYKGKRYIAFQEGFPLAEESAAEKGYPLYQSGGSVATFALDMLLRFECSQVVCIGLDLGYPGERTHASGIGSKVADTSNMRKVEGITSKYVYTSKTLDIYRRWIEKRIAGVKETELLNASKGARIRGMKEIDIELLGE